MSRKWHITLPAKENAGVTHTDQQNACSFFGRKVAQNMRKVAQYSEPIAVVIQVVDQNSFHHSRRSPLFGRQKLQSPIDDMSPKSGNPAPKEKIVGVRSLKICYAPAPK